MRYLGHLVGDGVPGGFVERDDEQKLLLGQVGDANRELAVAVLVKSVELHCGVLGIHGGKCQLVGRLSGVKSNSFKERSEDEEITVGSLTDWSYGVSDGKAEIKKKRPTRSMGYVLRANVDCPVMGC